MKELELLTILTNVRGEYLLEAQELRSGNRKQTLRRIHRKRVLLIAAVISLLLLLVGCAAVLIGLQKVSLGHMVFTDSQAETFGRDVISLHGYMDSPEYQAVLEWMEFENRYDPDKTLLHQADANHYMPPPDYEDYTCYTEEMCGKLDEICQKYGLALAGPIYFPEMPAQTLEAVEVFSIENEGSGRKPLLNEGRYYRSGSFYLGGTLQDRLAEEVDWDALSFQYFAAKKNVFFTSFLTTDNLDSFDAWEYTAWDGTQLMLAQNWERGLIYVDTEDVFISVVLYFRHGDVSQPGSPEERASMERIADTFRYALKPQEPKAQWLNTPEASENGDAGSTLQTYEDHDNNRMPGSLGSEVYSPDYQQKSEENILLQVLENQEPFFSMDDGTSCTLSEYCGREGERMGIEVAITRYAFVDMDGDGIQEAIVDFRFGENREVMCMVLRHDSGHGIVRGAEYSYRQMYLIKEDGSFAYSGGAANSGWAKLRWENGQWVDVPVEDSSEKPDVQWYAYPITTDEIK